jgi:hypothetical protein
MSSAFRPAATRSVGLRVFEGITDSMIARVPNDSPIRAILLLSIPPSMPESMGRIVIAALKLQKGISVDAPTN